MNTPERSMGAAQLSQQRLPLNFALPHPHPQHFFKRFQPVYTTEFGAAFCNDSLQILKALPDRSVSLVVTSPPYALHFKKEYGNVAKDDYVAWLSPFAQQIHRVLRDDGSFVLNIGGSYNPGSPTRSLYHFKLLIALCEEIGRLCT